MPFEARKFIFTVSLCAMLAVNPVLATAPKSDNSDLGTDHQVYVERTVEGGTLPKVEGYATSGIASVSYVNRMVDAAGNAADAAEQHAAAAGAYAISAAESADAAKGALKDKVDVEQTATNKFKAMVTDEDGTVYPGYISADMLGDYAVGYNKINATGPGGVTGMFSGFLLAAGANGSGDVRLIWQDKINGNFIDIGAIDGAHITGGAITSRHISTSGASSSGMVLQVGNSHNAFWGQIGTDSIENGAVTIDKTSGVVGMVPIGSATATTYGQFWIE